MDEQNILSQAIIRAYDNGYRYKEYTLNELIFDIKQQKFMNPFRIIFSHEFAKAFWGYRGYVGKI